MQRLRESWLALAGSALIVALTVSSAFGASSGFTPSAPVGQQIAEFARSMAPGQITPGSETDEVHADDANALEDGPMAFTEGDGVAGEGDGDGTEGEPQPGDEGYEWANHGECVSWHAHQDESAVDDSEGDDTEGEPQPGDEGYVWANHGEYVSWWATTGCWDALADAEENTEEELEEDEPLADESDTAFQPGEEGYVWANHGECVSWHARQDESEDTENEWRNHGEYVSHWAREGCPDEMAGADVDSDEEDDEENGGGGGDEADSPGSHGRDIADMARDRSHRENGPSNGRGGGNGSGRGGGRP